MSLIGDMKTYTQNKSKESQGFAIMLFAFFLVTILPQMLYIQRGDAGGTGAKAILLLSFYAIAMIVIIVKKIRINFKELLVGLLFLAIQIIVNITPSQYTTFSSSIMISIATATSYYIFFEAFFPSRKLEREDIALFARLYQIFIIYACLVNIVNNWSIIPSIITSLNGYAWNAKSFFSNRNTFALFLLAGIILSVYRLIMKRKNLLDTVIILFIILNLVLTLSRTALLGMFVFIMVLWMFREKRGGLKDQFKGLALVVTIICLIVATGLADFFIYAVIRVDAGSTNRLEIGRTAWDIFKDGNLLTGEGYGIYNFITFHNTYLGILLGGGLLLMFFYVRVFLRAIKTNISILKKEHDMGVFFAVGMLCYLIVSITESIIPFFSSAQDMIFTILLFMIPKYYLNSIVEKKVYGVR